MISSPALGRGKSSVALDFKHQAHQVLDLSRISLCEAPIPMNKLAFKSLSTVALTEAMEANMFGYMAYYAKQLPEMTVLDQDDLLVIDSGIPSDTFNYICRAKLSEPNIDIRIEEAINYFKAKNLPMAWWVGPGTQPSNLGDYLVQHGLKCTEYARGMIANLHDIPDDYPLPKELIIKQITTVDELSYFADVVASVFHPPDPCVQLFYNKIGDMAFQENSPTYFYLGYLQGEPVATSVLFLAEGVAGIYAVATKAQARKQGIGTALTLAALQDARKLGYQIGALQASTDGQHLYTRIGFKPCCQFHIYQ